MKSEIQWDEDYLILEKGEKIKDDIFDEELKAKSLGSSLKNGAIAHAVFLLTSIFLSTLKNLDCSPNKTYTYEENYSN